MSKVVYDHLDSHLRIKGSPLGSITYEEAKTILGYVTEGEKQDFKDDFVFRDAEKKKVRLLKNGTNRPFRFNIAERYCDEIRRGKWRVNGETIVIDRLGHVQSGQHRLMGLIIAEEDRLKDPKYYAQKYGIKEPLVLETFISLGVSEKSDTVDTLDLGQKRSLGDVLYRDRQFDGTPKAQQKLANTLAHATRLCWIRLGGLQISDAPKFPHSEALEFLQYHPKLIEAVSVIVALDAAEEGRKITQFISLGYAVGLFYLQATAKSKRVKYDEEGVISTSLWSKAKEFWTALSTGAELKKDNPILALGPALRRIDQGSAQGREEAVCLVINAWNLWIDEQPGDAAAIKVKKRKDPETNLSTIVEHSRIGGLDVEVEAPVPEVEETETDAAPAVAVLPVQTNEAKGRIVKSAKKDRKKPIPTKKSFKAKQKVQVSDEGVEWEGVVEEVFDEVNSVAVVCNDDGKTYTVSQDNVTAV